MLHESRNPFRALFLLLTIAVLPAMAQTTEAPDAQQQKVLQMATAIRKAIVTLPQYGIFDNINYGIKGSIVILSGQASRPTLKSGIENVVKKVEGIEVVQNDIEVLPVGMNDDNIRAATRPAAKVYGESWSRAGWPVRWPGVKEVLRTIRRLAGMPSISSSRMGT